MGFSTGWAEVDGELGVFVMPTVTMSAAGVVGTDVVELMTCYREFDWFAADNAISLGCAYTEWSEGSTGFNT